MSKITCKVVQDLLPLYVDEVLSDDSINIVDEHLDTCEQCTQFAENLKESPVKIQPAENADEAAALKKIKKKLSKKQIKTAALTALGVIVLAAGLFYGLVFMEWYIPYDESAVCLSDDGRALVTARAHYCCYGASFLPYEEDGTKFFYLTTTAFSELTWNHEESGLYNVDSDTTLLKEIYYVPREYAHIIKDGFPMPIATTEERKVKIEELKSVSVLVWQAPDSARS
ncbi:MAG: zf-HC2 domain-containing protein [Clostridia bacterium]|nr:zf-HC2 domain-containing protein [Clostridia bacterium]